MGEIVGDTLSSFGIGESSTDKANKENERIQQEMFKRLDDIGIPPSEAQRIIIESPETIKQLVPELEGHIDSLRETALKNIQLDPKYKQTQMSALGKLQSTLDGKGLTQQDSADIDELNNIVNNQRQSTLNTTLQNLAERGQLDPGKERLLRLQNSQNALSGAAQQSTQKADLSRQNSINAANILSQMASQQDSQDFDQRSNAAKANDIINQYNISQRNNMQQRDVGRNNDTQIYNLQQNQAIADQKVNNKNQQEIANKALLQQNFQNQYAKASGQVTANSNIADNLGKTAAGQGQASGQMWGSIGQGVGAGIKKYQDDNKIATKDKP